MRINGSSRTSTFSRAGEGGLGGFSRINVICKMADWSEKGLEDFSFAKLSSDIASGNFE